MSDTAEIGSVLGGLDGIVGDLEAFYRDLHAHPELSLQEHRTAEKAADHLRQAGFDVTAGVGGTGVVGLLAQRRGPDGDAAGGHGRPAGQGGHRAALRQRRGRHRQRGQRRCR